MNLTQMASASVKIIFDTVSGWRQAGHPIRSLFEDLAFVRSTEPPPMTVAGRRNNGAFRPGGGITHTDINRGYGFQGPCPAPKAAAAPKAKRRVRSAGQ